MDIRLEKRLAPRRHTMIIATLVYGGGQSRVDCVIRNLSKTGAKLEVATVRNIPDTFELMAPGHRPHGCKVVWRSLKEMGVEFT